ncbi:MAG: divergent polysaccharide deacetylase family protein [Bdellovibrionales bacterium]
MSSDPDNTPRFDLRSALYGAGLVAVLALLVLGAYTYWGQGDKAPQDISPASGDVEGVFDDLPQPDPVRNDVPQRRSDLFDHPLIQEFNADGDDTVFKTAKRKPAKALQRYSLKNPDPSRSARIAVIIDDMGVNRAMSEAVLAIKDAPLTLAFLPYAQDLRSLTKPAQAAGHELLIHMPMEPMNPDIDTGPIVLTEGMSDAEMQTMLGRAFDSFDGYVGINNHMGSRLTQNAAAMGAVMDTLKRRGLFYVDSKTIASSVGADAARSAGLDFAVRDVFLDHEDSDAFVQKALARTEKLALEKGYAIAIGHPKGVTVRNLQAWIPTLKARGFDIVPVSALLMSADARVAAKGDPSSRVKRVASEALLDSPAVHLQAIEPASGDVSKGGLYAPMLTR